jgi:hypothetical protein
MARGHCLSNVAQFACYRVERSGVTLVRSHIKDQRLQLKL